MYINLTKMLFFMMMMMSSILTISSNSWMSIWMGLEMNLMSFIPLMISHNNLMNAEASLNYFLIQAYASMFMLFSIIMNFLFLNNSLNIINPMFFNSIIIFSIMMKLGIPPFYFWFPNTINKLNWYNSLILLTWQKLAPMMIMSYLFMMLNIFYFIIIMTTMIGALLGLNQTSLRKIMAFSSINHMGWMITAMIINNYMWNYYFMIYFMLNMSLILNFNMFKIYYMNQLYYWMSNNYLIKMLTMITLLSLGGLPPLLGFLPKWLIIQLLMMMKYHLLIIFMMLMSLITLYFYLKMSLSSFIINYNEMNFLINNSYKVKQTSTIMIFLITSQISLNLILFMMYI